MAPPGVSVHFSRMVAHGPTGTLEGQEERNRTQIKHIGESAALLAMVKPDVIMLAHTATSYTLGRHAEAELGRCSVEIRKDRPLASYHARLVTDDGDIRFLVVDPSGLEEAIHQLTR